LKRDAVELVRSSGRPIEEVARELGCGETGLGNWLKNDRAARAKADSQRYSAEVAESDELKRLHRKVAELEVEREILKRSMVLLGKGVPRAMVFAFVDRQKADFAVKTLCRVCRVSRAGFYDLVARQAAGPTAGQVDEAELVARSAWSSRRLEELRRTSGDRPAGP
jgi:transposase